MSEPTSRELVISNLNKGEMVEAIKAVLPQSFTSAGFLTTAISAANLITKNPKVDPSSVVISIFKSAKLGLSLDPALGEGFLVPFKGVCTFMTGYKGYIKLARNAAQIMDVAPATIYKNEDFKYWKDEKGTHLHHTPLLDGDRGDPIAYYIITTYKSGLAVPFLMRRDDVLKRRNMSAQYNYKKKQGKEKETIWYRFEESQCWKTVIRAQAKTWPQATNDFRLQQAVENDEQFDRGEIGRNVPEEIEAIVEPPKFLDASQRVDAPPIKETDLMKEYKDIKDTALQSQKKRLDKFMKVVNDFLTEENIEEDEMSDSQLSILLPKCREVMK